MAWTHITSLTVLKAVLKKRHFFLTTEVIYLRNMWLNNV